MPDFLLELFSEEIPARMQAQAAKDLERLTVGMLTDRGFLFEGIKAFAGPRRLTLAITGLPPEQKDVREELKGPRVDAPQAALDGFLKKTGLTKDQLKVETAPKGDVYMAVIERKGRATPLVLAEIIPEVMGKLPWPKSMRWKAGDPVRWVRPLHSILRPSTAKWCRAPLPASRAATPRAAIASCPAAKSRCAGSRITRRR